MRRVKYALFAAGLAGLVSGSFLSRATEIPWVLSTLSPNYVDAQSGLSRLEGLDSLVRGDPGFEVIAAIFASHLRREGDTKATNWRVVEQTSYAGSQGSYATFLGMVTKMPVDFRLGNGQLLHFDLASLRAEVADLKALDFALWGKILFLIGLILYVAEFAVNEYEATRQQ